MSGNGRGRLLPLLRSEFNPQIVPILGRLAAQCRDWTESISARTTAALEAALLTSEPPSLRLRVAPLAELPRAERREALRLLWERHGWPQQSLTSRHWSALLDLTDLSGADSAFTLPGDLIITRRGLLLQIDLPIA